jgi:hypothetical protein
MMRVTLIVMLLAGFLLTSCDKKGTEPYSPWPVWILDVRANDGLTRTPVASCIRVVWRYSDATDSATSSCFSGTPSYARAWQPIREPVTIVYHIECNGYINTGDFTVYFDPELAYTRPGAPGDEVIEEATVSMYPE